MNGVVEEKACQETVAAIYDAAVSAENGSLALEQFDKPERRTGGVI